MTMTNAEWIIKQGYKFSDIHYCFSISHNAVNFYLNGEIIGNELGNSYLAAFTEWLDAERKEPILDDAEKRYLSAVIKPFRKRVEYISKEEDFDGPFDGPAEFIHIELSDGDIVDFPDFKANTMYKDMKLGYEYSLEELGL